jgi:acyl-coenzyme A thioesterase PaaI-like protein
MGIFRSFKKTNTAQKMRRLMNWYGPYVGAAVKLEYIADDWREVRVVMHMRWYNRNAVGTHFGGSLYAMIDPHYMLMLMKLLGRGYVVWDKAASIDFIKPGTGKLIATLKITDQMLADIKSATAHGEKYLPEYPVEIYNEAGELVAKVLKTLYIRKK